MIHGLRIRDATLDDLPAIVAIYNAAVATRLSTADLAPVTVQDRMGWFAAHSPRMWPAWVVEEGRGVMGWLSLQPFHPRAAYRRTAEVSVYVAPDHQRQGIGRALLAQAIQRAPDLGLCSLVALVFGHNAASLGLFQQAGFAPWGRLPGIAEMDGVERDLVILGRRV